ncbi:MAG: pyridoxal phosphate-dependent aminotransferase [Xanthomonadales bacterium]|nr:pyridoxal phosphate-dependent aminotransferase [Xanthomonadales bacterium]
MKSLTPYIRFGKQSETLLINQVSLGRENNDQQVFKFGFGQSPFPVPKAISDALAKAASRKEYMSVQGHPPLRQAIVDFHNQLEDKNWQADEIIVGAGSKILIFSVMAAFDHAEVLLPAPSWVSYEPQAKLAGHKHSWISTRFEDRWNLTAEGLENFCINRQDPKVPLILVLNYPNNPTGQSYSARELADLAVIMKKHEIIVIADEIYGLLNYSYPQASIAHHYPEGSITSSGLSKWCGAGGWRLGFIHVPSTLGAELFQAIISVASETYSCAPSPIQIAATIAYSNQTLAQEFLGKQIKLLKQISIYCTNCLSDIGIKAHPAAGAFYLFPDFSFYQEQLKNKGITTSDQLTTTIMDETGVALLPGSAFGMPAESLTTRLAFVDFDGSQILEKDYKLAEFNKLKQGIQKLTQWFLALD